VADVVVLNDTDLAAVGVQLDQVWPQMTGR